MEIEYCYRQATQALPIVGEEPLADTNYQVKTVRLPPEGEERQTRAE